MRQRFIERGSATAELVVALPILISLALFGVKFVGATLHHERLQFLAEGIVQAVMRDESSIAISRELQRALPGASYSISDRGDGRLTVTIRHGAASATADGFF